MQRYKAIISYDGTGYAGWQIQPDAVTIQGRIEEALHQLTGETPRVHSSGRTDTGVHACAQVIHFDLDKRKTLNDVQRGLLGILPDDIRVHKVQRASPEFHARRSATGKEYRYFIWNDPVLCPWLRHVRNSVSEIRCAQIIRT